MSLPRVDVVAVEPEFVHFEHLDNGCAVLKVDMARAVFHAEPEINAMGESALEVHLILMKSDVETVRSAFFPKP